jgi:hypothetical protein
MVHFVGGLSNAMLRSIVNTNISRTISSDHLIRASLDFKMTRTSTIVWIENNDVGLIPPSRKPPHGSFNGNFTITLKRENEALNLANSSA